MPGLAEDIKKLITSYMKQRDTIILAVIIAGTNLTTNNVLPFLDEANKYDDAIGVITKVHYCDNLSDTINGITDEFISLKEGYIGVHNPDKWLEIEKKYFISKYPILARDNLVGINSLSKKILMKMKKDWASSWADRNFTELLNYKNNLMKYEESLGYCPLGEKKEKKFWLETKGYIINNLAASIFKLDSLYFKDAVYSSTSKSTFFDERFEFVKLKEEVRKLIVVYSKAVSKEIVNVINKFNDVLISDCSPIFHLSRFDKFHEAILQLVEEKFTHFERILNLELKNLIIPGSTISDIAKNFSLEGLQKNGKVFNITVDNFICPLIEVICNINFDSKYLVEKSDFINHRSLIKDVLSSIDVVQSRLKKL
ncbi:hypothetical protein HK099_007397 [Clydaea vesicula]|uniref:Uncharacterized protein n=1 Tax=Clydaea vesicula TaxID=447962 RepID=A0AAD5XYI4_9FUNG|nr:hypothetical protein HK099_007397 [Clydaea vesicula]